MDVLLLCYDVVRSPTWTVRHLDYDSPPGRFAPLDVSIPGRFATSFDVSPHYRKFVGLICDIVKTSLSSGVETSRGGAKRPKVRNV